MKGKLLRVGLVILCLALVQCQSKTTVTNSPPTAFVTVRLSATNGVADSTFGGTGIVTTDINPTLIDFAMALAIQPDNKLVVGGSNGLAGAGQIALVRYNDADGALDTTFGGGTGIVKTQLSSPATASAIAIQPADGMIVVAALTVVPDPSTAGFGTTSITLLRYKPDGTPDPAFGTNGIAVTAPIGSGLTGDGCGLVLQNGKMVIVGSSQDGNLVLYRYDSAGKLDPTFGSNTTPGKTVTPLLPSASFPLDRSPAIALQSDNRIIVVTRTGDDQAVLRYSVDGALDTTFGGGANGGIVVTDIAGLNFANGVAIQTASAGGLPANLDRIVVVGHAGVGDSTSDISLVRYSKDGVPDTTFGPSSNGVVTTNINGGFDNAFSVALQAQAGGGGEPQILVSGNTGFNGASQTVILRYNDNGTADTSFGSAKLGIVLVPLVGPSSIASGNAIAVWPNHGIVVTGYD